MVLAGLAVLGWVLILTEGAGPFDLIAFVRERWTSGPLSCALCTGVWVGAAAAVMQLAADRWPSFVGPLTVLRMAGAGAALGWTSSRVLNYIERATECAEHRAWLYRIHAERVQKPTPE